jgi:hypothetical protein
MSLIHSEPKLFCILKSCHAWIFKRLFSNRLHMQDSLIGSDREQSELGLEGLLSEPRNDRLISTIFGQHVLFWIYEYYLFKFHELKLPKVNMLMGDTRK